MLKAVAKGADEKEAKKKFKARCKELDEQWEFIADTNIGGEFLPQDKQDRIRKLSTQKWYRHFDRSKGLSWTEERLLEKQPPPAKGWETLGEEVAMK